MDSNNNQIVSFIWKIADNILRDVFLRGQYRDVILPMVVLRRLDALLEPTKEAVEEEIKEELEVMKLEEIDCDALCSVTGLSYYNTSKWTLNRLKSQASDNNDILYDNFVEYLNGFSDNVKDVLRNFDYYNKAKKLASSDRLLSIIEYITDPHLNLTDKKAKDPDGLILAPLTNVGMGTVFEELLRRFNEENNEEAGEHFTPRDAISLLAHLVFEPVKEDLPKIISLYDPAVGSGGMLTESREYLHSIDVRDAAIQLSGTEINPETYAICKSDLIIKGVDPDGIKLGNTITTNNFAGKKFGYMITNPPYGKSWTTDKEKIYHDKALLDSRFELSLSNFLGEYEVLDCTPRTSDGQLLFILEEVDKMKTLENQPQGSRVASIHNGSSLFTGDAGSGESNIRRYLVENDLIDAIIQLPNNIFYNTGISTYVWLLTNKKVDIRKGKVQLIDASGAYEKLRKNQGSRNCTITPEYRDNILKTYIDFVEKDDENDKVTSKIFDGDDFRYYNVTIERPLRLRCQFSSIKCDELLFDKTMSELSQWLYQTYGEKVFGGLSKYMIEIKGYLNDNEIKLTDKKLVSLVSEKNWKDRLALKEAALNIMHKIGSTEYDDYNEFLELGKKVCKESNIKLSAAQLKTILRTMSVQDSNAKPVIDKVLKIREVDNFCSTYGLNRHILSSYGIYSDENTGEWFTYESDSDLRDTEKIPVKEDIYEYFMCEVHPYNEDAWINIQPTKIGCEISFNKYFYKPAPLRTLEENERDILELDEQSQGFIKSLFNLI